MRSLLEDISTLTTIGKYNLEELVNKSIVIVSHDVEESIREKENVTSIDIGIGELHISNIDGTVFFKFIPSRKLEEAVKQTYVTRKSALKKEIDAALGKRIMNTYKDLL